LTATLPERLDLAWRGAFLHELRGPDGRWVRGPGDDFTHGAYGHGTVTSVKGRAATVRFDDGSVRRFGSLMEHEPAGEEKYFRAHVGPTEGDVPDPHNTHQFTLAPEIPATDKPWGPGAGGDWQSSDQHMVPYTTRGNAAIEAALRHGEEPAPPMHPGLVDQVIAKRHLTQDTTLYRGIGLSPELKAKMVPGATFRDSAYTSTTTAPQWADEFANFRITGTAPWASKDMGGEPHPEQEPARMVLHARKGQEIGPGEPGLAEYVLPRDSGYRVTSVDRGPDGMTQVHADVLPVTQHTALKPVAYPDPRDQLLKNRKIDPVTGAVTYGFAPELEWASEWRAVSLAAWEHELRGPHGEWTSVANTSGARAEIGRQLTAQGLGPENPLRGVLQHNAGTNRLLLHRDPATGHIDAGVAYTLDKRLRESTHNISIHDVRVLPERQGVGTRMIAQLAKQHPEAKDMAVYGAIESAKPFYARTGARMSARTSMGEWDRQAMQDLRDGRPVEQTESLDFGWRFNPRELRNEHGEWTRLGETLAKTGKAYKAPPADRIAVGGAKASDNPFIKKYGLSTANIVASYDASTPDERAQGMRWYADAHDLAKAIAGGDADKGAAMLANFSTQTDWATDSMNATNTFANGKVPEHGVGISGSVRARGEAILAANSREEIEALFPHVGSAKTQNFYHTIRDGGDAPDDDEGQVTIDRHALSVAAGRRLVSSETEAPTYADMAKAHPDWTHEQMLAYRQTFPDDPTGSAFTYQHIADMYRQATAIINKRDGTALAPHQLQAVTWVHQLSLNNQEDAHLIELGAEAVRQGGKMGPAAAHAKGQAASIKKKWATWMAYAAAHQIPVHAGTTSLAREDGEAVVLAGGWRTSWLHELRGLHGEWTSAVREMDDDTLTGAARHGRTAAAAEMARRESPGDVIHVYHGTAPEVAPLIARHGLTAKMYDQVDPTVTADKQDAWMAGYNHYHYQPGRTAGPMAVMHIGIPRDKEDEYLYPAEGHMNYRALRKPVPPEMIYGHQLASDYVQLAAGLPPVAQISLALNRGELAWKNAWRTELRGPHGEWARSPVAAAEALSGHARFRQVAWYRLASLRTDAGPEESAEMARAMDALSLGDDDGAVAALGRAAEAAGRADRATEYRAMAKRLKGGRAEPGGDAGYSHVRAIPAEIAAVKDFLDKTSGSVPGMFGPNEVMGWDGATPGEFSQSGHPSLLADTDWAGHMRYSDVTAIHIQEALGTTGEVQDPDALTVPLHEMIHVVLPAEGFTPGQERGEDAAAYRDPAGQAIEEGFTQLGTAQHAAEFFDKAGVGARQTSFLADDLPRDSMTPTNPAYKAVSDQFTTDVRDVIQRLAATDLPHPVQAAQAIGQKLHNAALNVSRWYNLADAADQVGYLKHSGWPEFQADADRLAGMIRSLRGIPFDRHATMSEYAERMANPARIKDGTSWPHYTTWTANAQRFTETLAKLAGEADPEGAARNYADQVNATGASGKMRVMAELTAQAARLDTGGMTPGQRDAVLSQMETTIRDNWTKLAPTETVAKAIGDARLSIQAMQEAA
jgi:hypothetical protein